MAMLVDVFMKNQRREESLGSKKRTGERIGFLISLFEK